MIQAQGRSYDKFASKDLIILKYLTDKIQKFNTTDEGAPLINEDTCILDKNTSKTGQSSNSDYTPDCDTTFAKQVIENKTKEDNPCNKQYVESIEIDTFAKQVTQYSREKILENMENHFVHALEKVCKQHADMFASKTEIMENFYRNSVKDAKDKLCKILETITTSVKPSNTEHVKFVSQVHSLGNENHTLKTSIQDLRYKTELEKATLQLKIQNLKDTN